MPSPALAQPPGQTSDLGSVSALWKWNVLCQTTCLLISGIATILRTYVRLWVKRVWGLEDWLCCLAFIGLAVFSGLLTTMIYKQGGSHQFSLTKQEVINIHYYVNIIQIWYGIAAACTKSAILLLYLRVFSPHRWTRFDIAVRGLIFFTCAFYFALSIAKIFQCLPRARIWDKSVSGKCLHLPAILIASGIFNIVSDVCILLVPLNGVWNLQMKRNRKIGVYVIFTVGSIAPVFSTIGFIKRFTFLSAKDQSHDHPEILLWATAELAIGVLIICFPTLPGILQRRTVKPSASIINGSEKFRSTVSGNRKRYGGDTWLHYPSLDDEYHELTESSLDTSHVGVPQSAVVNEVRGGEDNHTTYGGLRFKDKDKNKTIQDDGILKVTEIKQSSNVTAGRLDSEYNGSQSHSF